MNTGMTYHVLESISPWINRYFRWRSMSLLGAPLLRKDQVRLQHVIPKPIRLTEFRLKLSTAWDKQFPVRVIRVAVGFVISFWKCLLWFIVAFAGSSLVQCSKNMAVVLYPSLLLCLLAPEHVASHSCGIPLSSGLTTSTISAKISF